MTSCFHSLCLNVALNSKLRRYAQDGYNATLNKFPAYMEDPLDLKIAKDKARRCRLKPVFARTGPEISCNGVSASPPVCVAL
jgi:hypothetical protein